MAKKPIYLDDRERALLSGVLRFTEQLISQAIKSRVDYYPVEVFAGTLARIEVAGVRERIEALDETRCTAEPI